MTERQQHQEIREGLARTTRNLIAASEKCSIGPGQVDIEELAQKALNIEDPIERAGAENIIREMRIIREGRI